MDKFHHPLKKTSLQCWQTAVVSDTPKDSLTMWFPHSQAQGELKLIMKYTSIPSKVNKTSACQRQKSFIIHV